MMDREKFIKALAKYLVGGQGGKSIDLQVGNKWAKEWSEVRSTTPIAGYTTEEEAEEILRDWLGSEAETRGLKAEIAYYRARLTATQDSEDGVPRVRFWAATTLAGGVIVNKEAAEGRT